VNKTSCSVDLFHYKLLHFLSITGKSISFIYYMPNFIYLFHVTFYNKSKEIKYFGIQHQASFISVRTVLVNQSRLKSKNIIITDFVFGRR